MSLAFSTPSDISLVIFRSKARSIVFGLVVCAAQGVVILLATLSLELSESSLLCLSDRSATWLCNQWLAQRCKLRGWFCFPNTGDRCRLRANTTGLLSTSLVSFLYGGGLASTTSIIADSPLDRVCSYSRFIVCIQRRIRTVLIGGFRFDTCGFLHWLLLTKILCAVSVVITV